MSSLKKRLAGIFIYADGCSLRLDSMLADPPPRRVMLQTEAQFKEGIVLFRLQAVRQSAGEAWYEQAGQALRRHRKRRVSSCGDVP